MLPHNVDVYYSPRRKLNFDMDKKMKQKCCIKQKSIQHHIVRTLYGGGLISKRPLLIYCYPLRSLVINRCPWGSPSRGPPGVPGRGPSCCPPGCPLGPWTGRPKGGKCFLSTTQNCHFQTNVQWMQSPAQPCRFFLEDNFYFLQPLFNGCPLIGPPSGTLDGLPKG